MNIIKWKRERVKGIFLEDVSLILDRAFTYEFTYSDKQGTLVFLDGYNWKKGVIGFASIADNKWVLKLEKEPFIFKIKLFDFYSGEYVARIRGDEFILRTGSHWIKIGTRCLLNSNRGKKLSLKVANPGGEIFYAWADYEKKNFFNNIYDSIIIGEIEYENEPDWELLFSAFITFHISLKSDQYYS